MTADVANDESKNILLVAVICENPVSDEKTTIISFTISATSWRNFNASNVLEEEEILYVISLHDHIRIQDQNISDMAAAKQEKSKTVR